MPKLVGRNVDFTMHTCKCGARTLVLFRYKSEMVGYGKYFAGIGVGV